MAEPQGATEPADVKQPSGATDSDKTSTAEKGARESNQLDPITTTQPPKQSVTQAPTPTMIPANSSAYEEYQLNPSSEWPPPIFVKKTITPQERYFLEHRWFSQWAYFDDKADYNKKRYVLTQLIIGIGSVAVPILVTIRVSDTVASDLLYVITIITSFLVAASAAIEALYKYGELWRSYRAAAEDLMAEKSYYDMGTGRYANKQPLESFARFVERTEEIVAQQNGRWIQSTEAQQSAAAERNQQILDEYYDDSANNPGGFQKSS